MMLEFSLHVFADRASPKKKKAEAVTRDSEFVEEAIRALQRLMSLP